LRDIAEGLRNVTIGGNAIANVIIAGDSNVVSYEQAALPPPETVDARGELQAIERALASLRTEDTPRIERAMQDAKDEVARPAPRKDVVGESLERALTIARQADTFKQFVEKLRPHVTNVTSWLGSNWNRILALVELKA